MTKRLTRGLRSTAVIVVLVLAAAACGGGSDDDGASGGLTSDGVASLETANADSDESALGSGPSADTPGDVVSSEQAALDFAECMRAGGIDFPDPTVDADGNPSFDGAFRAAGDGGIDPRSDDFRAVTDSCQELTEGFTFGRGPGGDFDQTALQDAMLPYTECLRDEGLDVGDFSFGGGPGPGADTAGQGERPERGGDPSGRIASVLGIDVDDPVAVAALETCRPHLDEAFSALGPGATADN